ncbi:microcin C transport system substrate-binding protein [Cohaesibacter sp. ES.047]|uniref:extracellular solute-binding protein n=1 Tax=Cohaesibacter sp. ES.047 TaxID=1798205 RepID=UPI000BBF4994|nr:extracellular solute-binding protein [Cohaesibacter sp. ES.047]SNY91837.1 microcin C transport system substrate-binding protein [Cohaesibacter sp. ES.047]
MPHSLRRRKTSALRALCFALAFVPITTVGLFAGSGDAKALEFETWLHGSSLMGEPKYQPGFEHFDYVNADAPKGGIARQALQGGYDSFNVIIPKGEPASGLGYIYDTLMTSAYDEISSDYGLIADAMYVGPNYSYVKYRIRDEARWHDGEPITPEDVVWSFEKLTELNPQQRFYYSHVTKAEVTGEHEVTFTFDQEGNRELPHIVGQLMILPKHWWTGTNEKGEKRDISKGTLEPPLGSGAYKIGDFSPGKYISYVRVKDYWGKDLNVNIGTSNFDELRVEYFRDDTVLFENFKSGGYDFRVEATAKRWATEYAFPAAEDGRVVKDQIPDKSSGVLVGFLPNLRREKFQDPRVREALNYVFNFEEMNRTLFYDQYDRINSFYFGSELASSGTAEGEVKALLEPLRDKIPPAAFEPYTNPKVESREDLRDNLKKALDLFKEAGWEPRTEVDMENRPEGFLHSVMVTLGLASDPTKVVMRNDKGEAFEIEYLLNSNRFERVALRLQSSLQRVGITMTPRVVDSAQYVNRVRSRDFDMIYTGWPQSLSPGNEQKEFFGSESADREGSANYVGIKNEAVDELINKVIYADDRETLVAATKALDRVLLANHYVIPGWTLPATRIAYWDRFGHPDPLPMLSVGFPTIWWWDEAKAEAVAAKN